MEPPVLLPGDPIPSSLLPNLPNNATFKLSPGLLPSSSASSGVIPTIAGTLVTNAKKSTLAINPLPQGGRYTPHVNDLIIAQIHHSGGEFYSCNITPHTPYALLPHLAFEGATRKTRPQLAANALVYVKVVKTTGGEVELSCVNPATGKSEGMGPLVGGCVFELSLGLVRRLLMPRPVEMGGVVVLEELGNMLQKEGRGGFEIAIGRNGRAWVIGEAGNIRTTIMVGRCLKQTDESALGMKEQKELVMTLIKGR